VGSSGDGRPKRRGSPEAIREILDQLLARTSPLGRVVSEEALAAEWRAAVGEEIAAHTRVAGLAGGRLRVEVDSSALLQELSTFYRRSILESLRAGKIGRAIVEVQFKLGAFDAPGPGSTNEKRR
jgi:predicted nucleic acid-binding Zn ribbon protein